MFVQLISERIDLFLGNVYRSIHLVAIVTESEILTQSFRLFVTPWIISCRAPLSVEFSRQEDWSGLLFPSPGDLPSSGIEPGSSAFQGDFSLSDG